MAAPMDPERKAFLDRAQVWAFVLAGVVAILTFPVVGIAFGLAAVALTYRTPLPQARTAGLVVAVLCVAMIVFGIGGGDGGGLID